MSVFDHEEFDKHEQISFFEDAETGLKAIIAIHDTTLGPALGGCRMWNYESDEAALRDALRLSRGMTYKSAVAGLPLGGGKSVIIGDAQKIKTPAMMRAMGRAVETFSGQYIAAEDVGMTVADMDAVHTETEHVVGIGEGGGDPSPMTAFGVYTCLKSAVRHRLDVDSVQGLKVAVQGLGNVGYSVCRHLAEGGADLFVTDVRPEQMEKAKKEFGATCVGLNEIYDVAADVFTPCALGAILNDETLRRLKVKVIAGAANNQLAEDRHGDVLKEMNVLYAPDYVINAGGVIHVFYARQARLSGIDFDRDAARMHVEKIGKTVESIFELAEKENISTAIAADDIAVSRFNKKPKSVAA